MLCERISIKQCWLKTTDILSKNVGVNISSKIQLKIYIYLLKKENYKIVIFKIPLITDIFKFDNSKFMETS